MIELIVKNTDAVKDGGALKSLVMELDDLALIKSKHYKTIDASEELVYELDTRITFTQAQILSIVNAGCEISGYVMVAKANPTLLSQTVPAEMNYLPTIWTPTGEMAKTFAAWFQNKNVVYWEPDSSFLYVQTTPDYTALKGSELKQLLDAFPADLEYLTVKDFEENYKYNLLTRQ